MWPKALNHLKNILFKSCTKCIFIKPVILQFLDVASAENSSGWGGGAFNQGMFPVSSKTETSHVLFPKLRILVHIYIDTCHFPVCL